MRQIKKQEHGQVNESHPYIYVITRRNLSTPQQCVQSCHASVEATKAFPQPQETCNLIVCTVADEKALYDFSDKLIESGIQHAAFCEPDIGNQLTALATEPLYGDQRKAFSNLPLMKGK